MDGDEELAELADLQQEGGDDLRAREVELLAVDDGCRFVAHLLAGGENSEIVLAFIAGTVGCFLA